MEILVVLLCLLVVATPILAILAFTRVQRLTKQLEAARLQDLVGRVYAIEQRIADLGKGPPSPRVERPAPAPPVAASITPASDKPTLPAGLAAAIIPPAKAPQEPPEPREAAESTRCPMAPLTIAHAKPSSSSDLEGRIAGTWFNRIAILLLIISVSYFLKLAFDNNWIGPSGRIAIGVLLGAAMLPWSQWLLGKGYSYFSEGIAALGQATLLLSVWAGCRYYTLFSREVGFAGMIVVTAVMAAVALGRNSERIALLSLLGGFLTPLLVSTGKDEQLVLFTYLLILGAGLLVIAARRYWRTLAPVSFVLTQL